jgi:hypothetical protein
MIIRDGLKHPEIPVRRRKRLYLRPLHIHLPLGLYKTYIKFKQ